MKNIQDLIDDGKSEAEVLVLAQDLIQAAYYEFMDEIRDDAKYGDVDDSINPEADRLFVQALLGKASG
jgi:hypothetical protein